MFCLSHDVVTLMLGNILGQGEVDIYMYVSQLTVVYSMVGKRSPGKSQEPEMIQVITKDLIRRLRYEAYIGPINYKFPLLCLK